MFGGKQVKNQDIIKWGILGALAEIGYILIIVGLFTVLDKVLATPPEFIGFLFMLLLFVFSVGVSGVFVFGYAAYLALQKKYKEAACTVFVTFSTMLIVLLLILAINLSF